MMIAADTLYQVRYLSSRLYIDKYHYDIQSY